MAAPNPSANVPKPPPRLDCGVDPDGNVIPKAVDENGHTIVDIEVADEVAIQQANDGAADTNVWHDGAGGAAVLAAAYAYGDNIAIGNKANWTLKCNLSNAGAGVTRVDIIVEVASSAAGTFYPIQVQTVAGTGVITLTDASWRRTVASADQWAFDIDVKGNAIFRVGARAGAGAPAGSAFLITAQPAGV